MNVGDIIVLEHNVGEMGFDLPPHQGGDFGPYYGVVTSVYDDGEFLTEMFVKFNNTWREMLWHWYPRHVDYIEVVSV